MTFCPTCRTQCEEGAPICPLDGTVLAPRDMIGQVLGERYRILERIGEGGMGTVYLCEHVALGRKMAVKLLRPEFCSDEEQVRRFQQEAQAASLIGHEHIVDVIDFGRTAEGSLYFVMEALEGESLAALLRRERLVPPRRALPILGQICQALAAAHARGIVHRDLKPDNVFLIHRDSDDDFVKVLDFGISKHGAAPENLRITRAGSIIGTPEYMAPEQAAAAAVDHRCDIYAFGVLAYEMMTGSRPFQGETALATLIKHQSEPPERPSRRNPGLPPAVERLILRALVKRPEGRQQSMAEVAADLSAALKAVGLRPLRTLTLGSSWSRRSSSTTVRFGVVRSPSGAVRASTNSGTLALDESELRNVTYGRRRWLPVGVAVSLALATAAGIGWWGYSRMPASQDLAAPVAPQEGGASTVELPATAAVSGTAPFADTGSPPATQPEDAVTVPPAPGASRPARLERQRGALRSSVAPTALGRRSATRSSDDRTYRKVDDLKPDPFREP
jgi:eukaryotic-like serine/threonine-protein kinase